MIRVRCTCGTTLKTPASMAGKRGRCPKCGKRVRIPTPSPITQDRPRVTIGNRKLRKPDERLLRPSPPSREGLRRGVAIALALGAGLLVWLEMNGPLAGTLNVLNLFWAVGMILGAIPLGSPIDKGALSHFVAGWTLLGLFLGIAGMFAVAPAPLALLGWTTLAELCLAGFMLSVMDA